MSWLSVLTFDLMLVLLRNAKLLCSLLNSIVYFPTVNNSDTLIYQSSNYINFKNSVTTKSQPAEDSNTSVA
jgi:hypothetical protein